MQPEEIKSFLSKYKAGTYSEEEHQAFRDWLKTASIEEAAAIAEEYKFIFESRKMNPANPELVSQIEAALNQYELGKTTPYTPASGGYRGKVVRLKTIRKIAVAASIILVIGLGTYFLFFNKLKEEPEIVKTEVPQDVKAPDGTKAMITLADGRIIPIDSLTSIDQSNVKLTKTANGNIIYSGSTSKIVYNTLSNPRGSKVIDMTLSDGSHVWLNAGSSMVFPIAFNGDYRKVFITGEAYLEVAHNAAKPFIVNANNKGEIEVLGTRFNVNAYDDEDALRTTLLEGKVKFTKTTLSLPSSDFVVLSPGQQSVLSKTGLQMKNNVDMDGVMAWKNGLFNFNNSNLEMVMRQLARWYDVEVVYQGSVPKRNFGGEMQRDLNLSEVLKILETNQVHFRIEGKKLIVLP